MNRSNMKSNISFQTEGRLIPRRKVATKSHLLNGVGDFDMELSLAIQESLKYAQEKDLERSTDSENNEDLGRSTDENETKEECSAGKNRLDHLRANSSKSTTTTTDIGNESIRPGEEIGRLKDLLLSQLELIQCQQEELNIKDKEIKTLQSSNDALQCRLERMERRLSLKQREESHERPDDGTNFHLEAASPTPLVSTGKRMEFQKKRRKGQSRFFSIRKRHKVSYLNRPSTSKSDQNGIKEISDDSDSDQNGVTSEDYDTADDHEAETGSELGDGSQNKSNNNQSDEAGCASPLSEVKQIDYPIMKTDILYHLYYPKHACPSSPDAKRIQEQLEVETPSWRLKSFANMYQLEGTENITDEAYQKRHQKFEQEEKRRKRWDMQRMRELRQFEKLEQQKEEELRASQDEADVETFLPSLQELHHIEITETLPVMAFGQPLPYMSPSEFEIPWEMNSSAPSTSTSKQKSGSGGSKRH